MPVVDQHFSSSKYGARGSTEQSLLLPSDAEQMLRVCLSMPQSREHTLTRSVFLTSLREQADVMPQCVFDDLCKQYPNIMQSQRILSQYWMRSWDRWIHIQDMLALYDKEHCMPKWLCEHAVIEITSVSSLHMVVSFPSEEQCRLQLLRDGFIFGDIDGFDYNCLSESVLHILLLDQMIKRIQTLTAMFQRGSVKRVIL